jgi:hypothetical protein
MVKPDGRFGRRITAHVQETLLRAENLVVEFPEADRPQEVNALPTSVSM